MTAEDLIRILEGVDCDTPVTIGESDNDWEDVLLLHTNSRKPLEVRLT